MPSGKTYDSALDGNRLNAQQRRVYEAMRYGDWWTLIDLSHWTGDPEASISARIRDLRHILGKDRVLSRRSKGNNARRGKWEYRIKRPEPLPLGERAAATRKDAELDSTEDLPASRPSRQLSLMDVKAKGHWR